mgnify:CR=1 FL=1
MSETILTNEIKPDLPLPIIPKNVAESAELSLHPLSSGASKISGGSELQFQQSLTTDGVVSPGGISFYSDFSKKMAFKIYHDTNNGKL